MGCFNILTTFLENTRESQGSTTSRFMAKKLSDKFVELGNKARDFDMAKRITFLGSVLDVGATKRGSKIVLCEITVFNRQYEARKCNFLFGCCLVV